MQVLADGRFAPLAQLGQHLAPDDALIIAQAAAAERRWRESAPKVRKKIPPLTWRSARSVKQTLEASDWIGTTTECRWRHAVPKLPQVDTARALQAVQQLVSSCSMSCAHNQSAADRTRRERVLSWSCTCHSSCNSAVKQVDGALKCDCRQHGRWSSG